PLMRRQLAAPAGATLVILLIAIATAALAGGGLTAVGLGLIIGVPAAVALCCCAAFSATSDPYAFILTPEIGYVVTAMPPLAASVLIGVPLLVAHTAEAHTGSPWGPGVAVAAAVSLASAAAVFLLGVRFEERDRMAG